MATLAVAVLPGCADDASSGSSAQGSGTAAAQRDLPPVTADYTWPEASVPEGHYPVTVKSCGEDVTFDKAPERAVVNDNNMVEMMFALGLTDHMAAYSAAGPRLRIAAFKDDYEAVTDMGPEYFKLEPTMSQNPDFVFAGWNYGFSQDGINPDALEQLGVKSYVLNESCRRIDDTLEPATIEEWYGDMRNLAAIFGVPERAEALIKHWDERLDRVQEHLPENYTPVPTFSYGWGTDTPGGGLGLTIVPELYRKAGAVNVFEDQLEMWGGVSWEAFVEKRPEWIVVTDYGSGDEGQSGEEKIAFLKSQKGIDAVPAIKNENYLI
ncbi:MAG: hypothetical protein CSA58_10625, partial [Micrococcales bacterium]